jgi:hypothetical protein
MNIIKSVRIPKPCQESWQQMTPVSGGRHCDSCCKTVIDFMVMTDAEIIQYLSLTKNVCGRFEQVQLTNINHKLHTENLKAGGWWKRAVIFLGMIGLTAFKAGAQQKTAIVKTADTTLGHRMVGKVYAPQAHVHKGKSPHKLPLPEARSIGVTLTLPETGLYCSTDVAPVLSDYNGTKTMLTSVGSVSVAIKASLPKRLWYKIKTIF